MLHSVEHLLNYVNLCLDIENHCKVNTSKNTSNTCTRTLRLGKHWSKMLSLPLLLCFMYEPPMNETKMALSTSFYVTKTVYENANKKLVNFLPVGIKQYISNFENQNTGGGGSTSLNLCSTYDQYVFINKIFLFFYCQTFFTVFKMQNVFFN